MKSATLFSGGEGAGLGMVAAGFTHAWGVEYDDKIAQVARDNGFNVLTADILQCDPSDFEPVDWLHASPPCPNFSNAKTNAEETDNDRALAAKVCEFITELLPKFVTLENVYQYRNSQSWETIARTLLFHGYSLNYWHVCMADYGVPQTRRRMIVIARRDGKRPSLPPATHDEKPQVQLFGAKRPWVSWYEAIEDLIPTLPDSEFASWQLERLPDEYKTLYVDGQLNGGDLYTRESTDPMLTIKASISDKGRTPRAFIAPIQGEASNGFDSSEPAQTIASNHGAGKYRAFIVNGENAGQEWGQKYREDDPAYVVTGNKPRAAVNGRIVKMTPRALARFQSFPDTYALPDSNALACRIIGNAVPPLFMQRLGEWLR